MLIGKNLGSYRILARGRLGESGGIYKAVHIPQRQTYALKLLLGALDQESHEERRFIEELHLLEKLDHPHIARLYPYEIVDDLTIIPLEFTYGQTVSEKIEQGPATLEFALRVALQTTQALEEAHRNAVIHRRLTSNNLMIAGDGDVKVLDFGLSLMTRPEFQNPEDEAFTASLVSPPKPPLSSVAYQSPEQVQGAPASPSSDLFSLGVILYELLAGQFLFEGENEAELFRQIQVRDLPSISQLRPEISRSWSKLLRGLLEKNPLDRYPSAEKLMDDLRSLNYGFSLDRLSFHTADPDLSRRSFFRRFLGDRGVES
jgi:eukaryotic-like serine/threonine-protein kinase